MHIDNKEKDILVLSKGLTQGLDNTIITAKAEYSISFSRSRRNFCLSLHHNRTETAVFYLLMSQTSIDSKQYPLCLGNISKYVTADNIKKQDYMVTCTIFLLIIIL